MNRPPSLISKCCATAAPSSGWPALGWLARKWEISRNLRRNILQIIHVTMSVHNTCARALRHPGRADMMTDHRQRAGARIYKSTAALTCPGTGRREGVASVVVILCTTHLESYVRRRGQVKADAFFPETLRTRRSFPTMRSTEKVIARQQPFDLVNPPAHAIVLGVDEKSQIQAPQRTQTACRSRPRHCGTTRRSRRLDVAGARSLDRLIPRVKARSRKLRISHSAQARAQRSSKDRPGVCPLKAGKPYAIFVSPKGERVFYDLFRASPSGSTRNYRRDRRRSNRTYGFDTRPGPRCWRPAIFSWCWRQRRKLWACG